MKSEDPTPQPGDMIIGKYRVKQVLGAGGMGVVVSAEHVQLGKSVALKFLRPNAFGGQTAVERFVREARASAQLKSEHVVRVTDVGTLDTGAPYMVMEHLTGTDLGDELSKRERFPVEEALGYVLQACEALAEAHEAGIIHRDLKPSNLFLTRYPDGSPLVKVLDFGISKTLSSKTDLAPSLTGTAELMGSPRYMSPEQIRSAKQLDGRADVWSLGIILYEFLAGRTPFDGESLPEVLAQIAADPPAPLSDTCKELPEGLEAVVMRCLEKNRDDRFGSVAQFAVALGPYASRAGRVSIGHICAIAGSPDAAPPSVPVPSPALAPAPDPTNPEVVSTPPAVRTATGWGTTNAGSTPQTKRWPLVASAGAAVALLAAVGIFVATRSGGVAAAGHSEVIASVVTQAAPTPSAPPPPLALPAAAPPPEPATAVTAPAADAGARRAAPGPAAKPTARPAHPAKAPGLSGLLDGRE
jgi:eukaryotic-like serine/threonine-protein kinase